MENKEKYKALRDEYPVFRYNSFCAEATEGQIRLSFDFEIEGLCRFTPETLIKTENLNILNDPTGKTARKTAFFIGLIELVSYYKAVLSPKVVIACGRMSKEDEDFFKKLYFGGLSEFFYINNVDLSEDELLRFEYEDGAEDFGAADEEFVCADINLIPVGGGKDSAVTANLLRHFKDKNMFFTVNDQKARTDTVLAAGYTEDRIVRAYRKIDPQLLELNAQGFLNGHTPFSAVVAFLSYYCAYLVGANHIVLSNEASANAPNIEGSTVNHQYSKSYEFERDFREFTKRNLVGEIKYFSMLRPFNELQIAKEFADLPRFHGIFRSCNRGSKQNIWCGECAKCLFVYSILSPFLDNERLTEIFGSDLFTKEHLGNELDGLNGVIKLKPFECVGTVEEVAAALNETVRIYEQQGKALPALLRRHKESFSANPPYEVPDIKQVLSYYNSEHSIPEKFMNTVREMYTFVQDK